MKSSPSSSARSSTAIAAPWLRGSPQIPAPVRRMAPKASRWIVRSPSRNVPLAAAEGGVVMGVMTQVTAGERPGFRVAGARVLSRVDGSANVPQGDDDERERSVHQVSGDGVQDDAQGVESVSHGAGGLHAPPQMQIGEGSRLQLHL